MDEQQRLQELELTDGVVCGTRCLLAFLAKDANAYVRFEDHVDVVGAVSNTEGRLVRESVSNHQHNLRLLLRRHTASQHDVSIV